jgi:hypothetical protein
MNLTRVYQALIPIEKRKLTSKPQVCVQSVNKNTNAKIK